MREDRQGQKDEQLAGRFEHGQGKYTWADGTVYDGEWKGQEHGQGTDGTTAPCTWASGKTTRSTAGERRRTRTAPSTRAGLNGKARPGQETHPDGTVREGTWKDGYLKFRVYAVTFCPTGAAGEKRRTLRRRLRGPI